METEPTAPASTTPTVRRLLVLLLLAAYVPALLVSALLLFVQYLHERREVIADMHLHVQDVSAALDAKVLSVQAHLARLSDPIGSGPLDVALLREKAVVEQRLAEVDAVVLFNDAGTALMNTRLPPGVPMVRGPQPVDVLSAIRLGRLAVSDVFYAPTVQRHMVGIGIPVMDGRRVRYALAAAIESGRLGRMLAPSHHGDWSVLLVDRRGNVVARSAAAEASVGAAADATLLRQVMGEGVNGVSTLAEAEGRMLAVQRSSVTGWTLAVSVPKSVLLAPVWQTAAMLLAVLLLLLVLGFAIAVRLGSRITRSIGALGEGARALREGGVVRVAPLAFREADEFARTFEETSRTLQERSEALARLTRDFDLSLLQQMESWQAQVGRELHDSVASSLGGVSLLVEAVREEVHPGTGSALLARSQQELRAAAELVRKISRGVMPAGIDPGALLPALERLAEDANVWHGMDCRIVASGDFDGIDPQAANHVYRIVQEAVTNARRHGGARQVTVSLRQTDTGHEALIADDGSGGAFAQAGDTHSGVGLRSMRARAEAIRGQVRFGRTPEGGCLVHLRWGAAGVQEA